MICKQLEVADILKSLLLSSFRFSVFLYLSFKERTANPVIRFLLRTEYALMGCQEAEMGWTSGLRGAV